jgi:hypothetical protein
MRDYCRKKKKNDTLFSLSSPIVLKEARFLLYTLVRGVGTRNGRRKRKMSVKNNYAVQRLFYLFVITVSFFIIIIQLLARRVLFIYYFSVVVDPAIPTRYQS